MSLGGDSPRDALFLSLSLSLFLSLSPPSSLPPPPPPSLHPSPHSRPPPHLILHIPAPPPAPHSPTRPPLPVLLLPPGEDILGVAEEGQEHGNLINECGPLPVSLAPRRLPEAPAVRDFKWQDIDTRRAKRLGLSVCARVCVWKREKQREKICARLSVHAFV